MVRNQTASDGPDEVAETEQSSALGLAIIFLRHKRMIVGFPLGASVIAALVLLILPNWYTATTKLMPPQQSQSNAVAILGQLGALAGGGASQALGIRNPSDIYVAMLKSRTVADSLIKQFDLRKVYDEDTLYYTRRKLARNSSITASRDGVITVEVEDEDPKLAAALANAYVHELRDLTLTLAVTEASQRRLFFEGQLKKAKSDLTTAEIDLKKFTEESGLVNPQGQVSLSVAAAAALRAQISAREIQLAAMKSFATENNPDIQRTRQELASLRGEIAKIETDNSKGKSDVLVPFGKAPGVSLEYVRKYRDVKYFETLYEVLAKQYEIARIDEAKDATLIQVLDPAVPPERKSGPKRTLTVLVVLVLALLVAMGWSLLLEKMRVSARNPRLLTQWAELERLLKSFKNFKA